jgi:ADP-heptose:LPS heptosyltransferase
MPEAVVIQWSRLGDVLQTRALLCALRRTRPELRRVLCLDARYAGVARRFPELDDVWPIDLARLHALASHAASQADLLTEIAGLCKRYDGADVQDAYVLSRSLAAVLFAEQLCPRDLRGYQRRNDQLLMPDEIQRLENAFRSGTPLSLHLADLWASWCPGAARPEILPPLTGSREEVAREGIGLLGDAGEPYRTIPRDWLALLCRELTERFSCPIYLFGQQRPQDNDPLSVAVIESFGQIRDLRSRTNLDQLFNELSARELVIGPDTGALHLAAACTVPVVGLYFGGALAVHTGPYSARAVVLQNPGWTPDSVRLCANEVGKFLSYEVI